MVSPNLLSVIITPNVVEGRLKLDSIFSSPTQTLGGIETTAWGLVQGAIEYSQWYRKARSDESRFERAYLNRSRLTSDALDLALTAAKS